MHVYTDQYSIAKASVTWRPEDQEVRLVIGNTIVSLDRGEAENLVLALQEVLSTQSHEEN